MTGLVSTSGGVARGGVAVSRLAAVVFDVDGTLVDSERDGHRVAFNTAFDEAGLADHWDVDTYGRLIRVAGGAQRLVAWFDVQGVSPDESRELAARLHRRKTEIMRDLVRDGRIRPRPGVPELIDRLAAAGVPMHVATTGTRAWVEPLLDRVFGDRFGIIVTGTEVPDLKPSPAVYLEVLRRIGSTGKDVVAVEDSSNGVRAGVGAGLTVVAVSNPYTCEDDLGGAVLVAHSFEDPTLIAWFDERMPDAAG